MQLILPLNCQLNYIFLTKNTFDYSHLHPRLSSAKKYISDMTNQYYNRIIQYFDNGIIKSRHRVMRIYDNIVLWLKVCIRLHVDTKLVMEKISFKNLLFKWTTNYKLCILCFRNNEKLFKRWKNQNRIKIKVLNVLI